MDFVLDLPQVSCGEGFQLTFDQMLGQDAILGAKGIATNNKCHASSNRCLTSSSKKLLGLLF